MDPFHVSAAAMFFSAMLLLTLLSGITASAQETTTSSLLSTSCEPAMCGSLRIEYPFWLGGTHPPECGYWAFQVSCHSNGTASLKNSIWTYQILEISYPDSTFRVTNSQLSDGTCDFELRVNASSELGLAPFSISAANHQLFFLYNCTEQQARQPPPTWAHVNCANGSLNNSFALLAGNYKPDDKWEPENCTVSMMPVLGYPGATGANYNRLIKGGFRLEYTAGDCTSCRETGGLCRINTTYDIFECRCSDGVSDLIICHSSGSKGTSKKIILIVVTSAAGALLFTCIYVLVWRKKGKRLRFLLCKKTSSNTEKNYEAMIVSYGSLAPKRYMYSEVMKITSSRNDQLGKGGYGVVFKGSLHDGRLVAVKFLHDCKGNGDEFVNEVMSIGRTSHVNVVSLYGFCLEGSKRALIYEYMPNGSLDKYIYSEHPKEILGWERLYGIAIGIARGLEYLHHSCNTRIVHFDIKPQNILLDKDFSPKIADFGLAKLCHTKESKVSMTGTRGTIGFIAPEVHSQSFGVVSTKSDVYSYGMMLLEMVGGRRNVKPIVAKSSEKYFPDWIYDHFAQDDGLQACEVTSEIEEIARKMTLIGLWCVQILPAYRPTITKVLEMFERSSDDMDMPPKQNFSGLLESAAHNMDVQSSSSTRSEEISLVNSKILQQSPTL
ncbi:LEAF RUST 10 DISEASE-RESISTANCE LOCUS RECEPTOR-LIKE PROTEIN KINASE-like 2.4 [Triticum urartu]|nr:LEAF RUST 10 DISEASE-RESISTANCE LOCUS RECEPTOR-LIKE PROTEIN KINASE-like 2.4 [Triticum urartu]XP_048561581.1 LEAF RUST 10 DISEASE-RESISTANCE LOCUS RECEPTOR-LIKE PROTEIN KINASE-like 2.4 [Triticum urartu]